MSTELPAWLRRPMVQGLALGFALPLLVVSPAVLAGRFHVLREGGMAYFLLPWLALTSLPAALAAGLLQRSYRLRPALWRLCTGLLLGGWLAGSLILWHGTGDAAPARRMLFSLFGGAMLAGFWTWIGGFLGGYWAFERRQPKVVAAAPSL